MNDHLDNMRCPDCAAVIDIPEGCQELRCECGAVLISEEREQAEQVMAEELSRKWYYSHDNQRYGPVPWNKIKTRIKEQKLGADDLIWSQGMQRWEQVRQFDELRECFPEDQRPKPLEKESSRSQTEEIFGTEHVKPVVESGADKGKADVEVRQKRPRTFLVNLSAGLLVSLAVAQVLGIIAVIYGLYNQTIRPDLATWLIAAFIVGAILTSGLSQLMLIICHNSKNISRLKEQWDDFNTMPQ